MDRMLYLAMSGAKATMQRQDVLSNNLANASTTGFRAELQAFRAVPVRGDGATTRVYALESTVGYDAQPGTVPAAGPRLGHRAGARRRRPRQRVAFRAGARRHRGVHPRRRAAGQRRGAAR